MTIRQIRLSDLSSSERYCLSVPIRPDIFPIFSHKFPGFPPLIINPDMEIIFGNDACAFMKERGDRSTLALESRLSLKEGLFLNYNLKESFFGLNRFEKLLFLKKILPLSTPEEIQRQISLDMTIDRELSLNLEALTAEDLKNALVNDRLHPRSALRILKLKSRDRTSIIRLMENHSFSMSHQLALLDMLEEIAFRDRISFEEIFERAGMEQLKESEKPQRKIMKAISALRYPFHEKTEREWRKWIDKLKLPDNIQIRHADFFEKKQLEITMKLNAAEEVEDLLRRIKKGD